jgi:hypothetical protein
MNIGDITDISQVTYTYSVTCELALYPGFGSVTAVGTISIVDPCVNPTSLVVGTAQYADSDYTSAAVFVFPVTQVVPQMCIIHAVYTCVYVTGPYQGLLDLCDLTH